MRFISIKKYIESYIVLEKEKFVEGGEKNGLKSVGIRDKIERKREDGETPVISATSVSESQVIHTQLKPNGQKFHFQREYLKYVH